MVFTPKYRFKILTGAIKDLLEHDIRSICSWKEDEIIEMNIQIDHVHMYISIPPKISVSDFLGILKGKTAIKMFKSYPNLKKKPYWGHHFWSRGYFINTVGMDADLVQRYVKYQETEEKRQENDSTDFTLF